MKTNAQKEQEYRANQTVAHKLSKALGPDYEVLFDDCESCLTRFFYKGHFYKQVPNTELVPSIDVGRYRAPDELVYRIHMGLSVPVYG